MAEGAGADRVQAGRLGAQESIGLLRRTSLTNFVSRLLSRPVSVSALHRHHRLLSDAPVFQPSAIEFFRSPFRDWKTLRRRTSRRRRHALAVEM